jgi:hypothetical protein
MGARSECCQPTGALFRATLRPHRARRRKARTSGVFDGVRVAMQHYLPEPIRNGLLHCVLFPTKAYG